MAVSPEAKFTSAYAVASALLMMDPPITQETLDNAVETVGLMPDFKTLDLVRLRKQLEADNNVHVGGYSVIDDKEFRAWIGAEREKHKFAFWDRYRNYLEKRRRIPKTVVEQLDHLTDDILDRLRDPTTEGRWDRRGLVVGDVQSGKTSNYTGLICKAVDAGFPLVIVLAGIHNSLRSQTQMRLDEGFLGFDTRLNLVFEDGNQRIGAGALPGAPFLVAHSLTSSIEVGDFRRTTAQGTKIIPGGRDPVILVVKKNVSVLKNLMAWVLSVRGELDPDTPGGKTIRDVPLLMIDDEADFASPNTNEYRDEDGNVIDDNDPTKTNRLIRQMLSAFEKSAYVGYTATPFANVFMHHEAVAKDVGKDLFPSSFIINIPAPSNYIGAERVFGLERAGGETRPLPIIRPVLDAGIAFPPKHRKDLPVSSLPATLHEAILAFILACAGRRARGETDVDNSMLVHVTRFTNVQHQVASLIEDELGDVRRQLEYPGTGGDALVRLKDLWFRDFAAKHSDIVELLPDHDLPSLEWDKVEAELYPAANRIEVKRINGSAKDALDYLEHPLGLSVIAVGGDKLSRGLTLEGLSISYFVRTSRMYDTLMQMGRWFGYRPRYADLCRLYTEPELSGWYRHIATAMAELREEFDLMFAYGSSPLEFGHRVQTHPNGLLITAANKMRASNRVRAGFSGTIAETVSFELNSVDWNYRVFEDFLRARPAAQSENERHVWRDVPGQELADLMRTVRTSGDSWKANSAALAEYIRDRVAKGRLTSWTVALIAGGRSTEPFNIAGYAGRLTTRSNSSSDAVKYTIGRLISPVDEPIDLTPTEREEAIQLTISAWEKKKEPKGDRPKEPSGAAIRKVRTPERGLLLLYPIVRGDGGTPLMGFALSFPEDKDAPLVEYAENSVKQLETLFE